MHTLVICEQGAAVHAEGDTLLVQRGSHVLRRARVAELDQLLLLGRVEVSHRVIVLLLRRGVDTVWLTQDGRFRGRLLGRSSKHVELRLAQYRRSQEQGFALEMAKCWVSAKIRQQRQLLLRAQRRLQDPDMATALGQLRLLGARSAAASDLDSLRGLEGQAAAVYFGHFGRLIRVPEFTFTIRTRRPPRDPVNALLSFGYAVLGSLIETDLYRRGLDPLFGFLHQPAYGRASLMLDLLEEYRPLVDSLVLRLVNRRQLSPEDFVRKSGRELGDLLAENPSAALEGQAVDAEDRAPPWDDESPVGRLDMAVAPTEIERSIAAGESHDVGPDDVENAGSSANDAPAEGARRGEDPMGVYLGDMGRRIFLNELFRRLRERVRYPPRDAAFELRDVIRHQIYHLARVISGEQSRYEPFLPD